MPNRTTHWAGQIGEELFFLAIFLDRQRSATELCFTDAARIDTDRPKNANVKSV
jgi:hypothetical protein